MWFPPRVIRRALVPVELAALIALCVLCVLAAALGAIAAPFTRRRRLLRVAAFGLAYCFMELTVLVGAFGIWVRRPRLGPWRGSQLDWVAANQRLLTKALGRILDAARRTVGFEVVVDELAGPDPLADPRALLVVARHAGPGDSFALVHLLLARYHRGVRIVVKQLLQLDPALDVLLNRLGCCFLPPSSGSGESLAARLASLAGELKAGDALLLFPEGGNWTPERRRRAIRRLGKEQGGDVARSATLMSNVLPPRPAGILACLDARPDIGVTIVAHAGLDRLASIKQVWRQLPLTVPMRVRAWPAAPAPPDEDGRRAWLLTEWAVVDEWVDAHHANPAAQLGLPPRGQAPSSPLT